MSYPHELFTLEQAEEEIADLRGQIDRLSEVISLGDISSTPNTPSDGSYIYTLNGMLSYQTASGLTMSIPGTDRVWQPSNTITGTGFSNLAAYTVPANDAVVNAVYEVETWGNGQQGSTNQTLAFATYLGGTQMSNFTFGTTAMPTSHHFRFRVVARVVCVSTGTSGTFQSYIWAEYTDFDSNISSSNVNTNTGFSTESTGIYTIDSTTDNDLAARAAWGGTGGSPTITSRWAMSRRINLWQLMDR